MGSGGNWFLPSNLNGFAAFHADLLLRGKGISYEPQATLAEHPCLRFMDSRVLLFFNGIGNLKVFGHIETRPYIP